MLLKEDQFAGTNVAVRAVLQLAANPVPPTAIGVVGHVDKSAVGVTKALD